MFLYHQMIEEALIACAQLCDVLQISSWMDREVAVIFFFLLLFFAKEKSYLAVVFYFMSSCFFRTAAVMLVQRRVNTSHYLIHCGNEPLLHLKDNNRTIIRSKQCINNYIIDIIYIYTSC